MSDGDGGDAIRLAKRVAAVKGCSRSEAERYIEGGWVRVDGQIAEDPATRVTPAQAVTLDAGATLLAEGPVTLLLYKPAGDAQGLHLLTADRRSSRDTRPIRPLRKHFQGLTALAPLPAAAAGLVVFTQDWRVQRKLTEDADVLEHEIMADVANAVDELTLQKLRQGLQDGARMPAPVRVSISSVAAGRTRLRFAFKGMAPAQLEALCTAAGLQLQSFTRQRIGRVALAGLSEGQWRYLDASERF